jgi:hypothetical protein
MTAKNLATWLSDCLVRSVSELSRHEQLEFGVVNDRRGHIEAVILDGARISGIMHA